MNRAEQAEKTTKALYGGASALGVTDPEFAAIKERLIYGEVYAEEKLSARLRELVILVVATTNQTMNEVKRHTAAALACGVKPEEIKEAVYHCAPYIGLGKAENAVNAVNAVFAEKGIVLPLASGQTVTEESRLLDGIAAQKSIFGDQIDAVCAAAPENQKNIQDDLSAYCFGDFYTRKFLPIHERELLTFSILASQGGWLRRAGQGPRRRERRRRQREEGPARGAHGVPAVYRLPAHAQRAFLHQRGPSGSETVRNFNR